MTSIDALDFAFRTRAEAILVATTGAITLAATTSGYTRTTGSFLDDGFRVGMELAASGFTSNPTDIITEASALTLKVQTTRTAETAASGRTLSVGWPAVRCYPNTAAQPIAGRPFVEAEAIPGGNTLRAGPAQGGTTEQTGLYVVRWYGLAAMGAGGVRRAIDALAAHFTPGTTLTVGTDVARVRGDIAPTISQLIQRPGGWCQCTLTIPWRVFSTNAVV